MLIVDVVWWSIDKHVPFLLIYHCISIHLTPPLSLPYTLSLQNTLSLQLLSLWCTNPLITPSVLHSLSLHLHPLSLHDCIPLYRSPYSSKHYTPLSLHGDLLYPPMSQQPCSLQTQLSSITSSLLSMQSPHFSSTYNTYHSYLLHHQLLLLGKVSINASPLCMREMCAIQNANLPINMGSQKPLHYELMLKKLSQFHLINSSSYLLFSIC